VIVAQLLLVLALAFDPRIGIGAVFACVLVFTVLERPLLGVALLLVARLMDTAHNAFLRIGHTAIGFFEVFLLLALGAMSVYVVRRKRDVLISWPWQLPFFVFVCFQVVSFSWSANIGEGISEVVTMAVVLVNAILIISFVRTPRDFLFILFAWITASVTIGAFSAAADYLGISTEGPWKAAEGGGRETGFGQQPNWYAMNLMFIVHTTFGLALVQRRKLPRWLLVGAGLFIFVSMLRSGSRGGIYSVMIGGGLTALALPVFRKWFFRFLGVVALVFAGAITLDMGSTSQALGRIWDNLDHTWAHYRGQNWAACVQMAWDTYGRGVGAGGYLDHMEYYNYHIYTSDYHYPHGIFWGLLAHYGLIGLGVFAWLAGTVIWMARRLQRWTRDSLLEIFTWTMPATMVGYIAWSFVEFEYNEKPFWEFLSLFTALYLMVERARKVGVPLPSLPGHVQIPWHSMRSPESEPPEPEAPAEGEVPATP